MVHTSLYFVLMISNFWRRNHFFNFSTSCIINVNNTGTKYVRIMKQTAFWRKKWEHTPCLIIRYLYLLNKYIKCNFLYYRCGMSTLVDVRRLEFNILGGSVHTLKRERIDRETWGGREHLEYLGVNGKIILKWIFRRGIGTWTWLIWLRLGTGGGLLWIRKWIVGFHKMRGISWLAEIRLASQEGLCFIDLVS